MTLDEVPQQARAVVLRVGGAGADRSRLMALGLLPGVEVTRRMTSPLGDPTAYLVRGCLIALRRSQARCIEVRLSGTPT